MKGKKIIKSYVTACVGIQTNEKVDLNIDHMIAAFVCLLSMIIKNISKFFAIRVSI
jgi:hypothetical protein